MARPAISATHFASGSARVIPTTIEEGEADGTASAVALRGGIDFAELATRVNGVELGTPQPALLARAVSGSRRSAASRNST